MTNKRSVIERKSFPTDQISKLAEKESWRKEVNRPIYHIHKWWAQRLGSVFRAILIYLMDNSGANVWDVFYDKHDFSDYTVLDPFMGSGTTVGEALKLGANVIGCDINPVSTFMVRQELTRVSLSSMCETFKQIEADVAPNIRNYYKTLDPETGNEIPVLYYFWVKLVSTPSGEEIPLFSSYIFAKNAYPTKKPQAQIICPKCWNVFTGRYDDTSVDCPCCHYEFNPQKGPATTTTVIDSTGAKHKIRDLIPAKGQLKEKIYAVLAVSEGGTKIYLPTRSYDLELYHSAQKALKANAFFVPYYSVRPGYNTDQARNYNYLSWKDFFNDRQLLCLGILIDRIMKVEDEPIREQLLCLFSSTLEYNNMFCSFKGEGTGAVRPIFSNHILKPERTPLENSIWGYKCSSGCFSNLFKTRLLKAKEYLDKPFEIMIDESKNKCYKVVASNSINAKVCASWPEFCEKKNAALILNGDSSTLPIPDNSVDFVVTDPPYFDFIHYSELSDFFYAWLSPILKNKYSFFENSTSGRDNEVQQTDSAKFSQLLEKVFTECSRVLKPEGKLVFSFHHSRPEGWIAIANAIRGSGFAVDVSYPVHAELMASTPKTSTKEPISLDAIIVCGKKMHCGTINSATKKSIEIVREMLNSKKISQTDIFVISASQSLSILTTMPYSQEEQVVILNQVYENTLSEAKKIRDIGRKA